MHRNATPFEKCLHINLSHWSDNRCGHFYSIDMKTVLVHDTSSQGVTVKKTRIFYGNVRLGLLACRKIGEVEVIRY